jgi:mRNA interferase MazF
MKRGEVWWVDFSGAQGGEIQKRRAAVILSNDQANQYLNRVQLVPLSSRVERVFPSEALVQLDGRPCKAMADQLTTASKTRLLRRAGELRAGDLEAVERAVRLQLGLN